MKKGYFFDGGYYPRGNLNNALIGGNMSECHKACVN